MDCEGQLSLDDDYYYSCLPPHHCTASRPLRGHNVRRRICQGCDGSVSGAHPFSTRRSSLGEIRLQCSLEIARLEAREWRNPGAGSFAVCSSPRFNGSGVWQVDDYTNERLNSGVGGKGEHEVSHVTTVSAPKIFFFRSSRLKASKSLITCVLPPPPTPVSQALMLVHIYE